MKEYSMAAAANLAPSDTQSIENWYGHSMDTYERLGELMILGAMANQELQQVEELIRADFETGLAENLKTDPEMSEQLDVSRVHEHDYSEGRVRAADEAPMLLVVHHGLADSRSHAKKDIR